MAKSVLREPLPDGDLRAQGHQLGEIGKMFRTAHDLASRCPPDTMGGRAAWGWAEKATEALGAFVEDEAQAVAPMVRAMATKLFNK